MKSKCPHNSIRPWRISEHLTKLLCTKCGVEIAQWIDKVDPREGKKEKQMYSDDILESLR